VSTRLLIACGLLATACTHGEPSVSGPNDAAVPKEPGVPARLTYNPWVDLHASWLPDGSATLYSFEKSAVHHHDRCLALMPAHGGARRSEICNRSPGQVDSTEHYGPSAVSQAGRLAYGYTQATPGRRVPNHAHLRVATLADPQGYTVVHPLPMTIDGTRIDSILMLQWLGENRLAYLGAFGITNTTSRDRIIVAVDLAPTVTAMVVPGTRSARSLAASTAVDSVAFTRRSDGRVYQQALSGGTPTVLHDFSPGVPGHISIRDHRLATTAGTSVIVVDLLLGTSDTMVGDGGTPPLGNPALSLTGAVVVGGGGDLWLFEASEP
jgi:hypothetical protein